MAGLNTAKAVVPAKAGTSVGFFSKTGSPPSRRRHPSAQQSGFTYIGFLIFIAIAAVGLAAYGEVASHATQREKEAELLFRGNAYQAAIGSYYRKEQRYPASLEALLEDKRYPMPVRHLRKLYADPMTGEPDWVLIDAPGGGVMGVRSRSEDAPVKTGNFRVKNQSFEAAQRYADWQFVHSPPGLVQGVEKSPSQ